MRALLDLLFPPVCLACARVEAGLRFFCAACLEEVEPLPFPRCQTCAEPGTFSQRRCPRCVARPPPFTGCEATYVHGGAVARAIHAFKYGDHPEAAEPLAELILERGGDFFARTPGALCALPLHRARFVARKYDQAQLLARALASRLGRPWLPDALVRTRETQPQVGLSEPERELNVAGAFVAAAAVHGQTLILVDDVLTTGATARAGAQALRDAGARAVSVVALARAWAG